MANEGNGQITKKDLQEALHHTKQDLQEALQHTRQELQETLQHTKQELQETHQQTVQTLKEYIDKQNEASVKDMKGYVDHRSEQVETKLLTAFHSWARGMEVRVRGVSTMALGYDERLAYLEERIGRLERGDN